MPRCSERNAGGSVGGIVKREIENEILYSIPCYFAILSILHDNVLTEYGFRVRYMRDLIGW